MAVNAAERLSGERAPYIARAFTGAGKALWAVATFFTPLVFILLLTGVRPARPATAANLFERIAVRAAIAGAAMVFIGAATLGFANLQERYVVAFLFPGVFWLISSRSAAGASERRRYASGVAVCIAAIVFIRIIEVAVAGPPFCKECRQWINYAPLEAAVAQMRPETASAIVGFDDHTAGNLRRLFPEARVLSAHLPFFTPPAGTAGPCLFVWSEDLGPPPPDHLAGALKGARVVEPDARSRSSRRRRDASWRIARLESDSAVAGALCRF